MHLDVEKKIVRIAILILFGSLIFVYAVYFHTKGYELLNNISEKQLSGSTIVNSIKNTLTQIPTTKSLIPTTISPSPSKVPIKTGSTITGSQKIINSMLNTPTPRNKEYIPIAGTIVRYGETPILDKLGINYQYILKDEKRKIYFIYLGINPTKHNIKKIVSSLGGNTVEITKENDINKNALPGPTIFLNINEFKDRYVTMVITDGYENKKHDRIVIVDKANYYKLKSYIQKLFK